MRNNIDYLIPLIEEHGNTIVLRSKLAQAVFKLKQAGIKFDVCEPTFSRETYVILRKEK